MHFKCRICCNLYYSEKNLIANFVVLRDVLGIDSFSGSLNFFAAATANFFVILLCRYAMVQSITLEIALPRLYP